MTISTRLKWRMPLLVVLAIAVLTVVLVSIYAWYMRSSSQVKTAVVGSDGDLYVLLESQVERPRSRLLAYQQEDGFSAAKEISLGSMPGCDAGDPVVLEDISTDQIGISILGWCAWGDAFSIVWTYSSAESEFVVAAELDEPTIDKAVAVGAADSYEVVYTDVVDGSRFCGSLMVSAEDGISSIDYRAQLDEETSMSGSCPSGVWSLAAGGANGRALSFLVKEREEERFFVCQISDMALPAECRRVEGDGLGSCRFNQDSTLFGCQENIASEGQFLLFSALNGGAAVAECGGIEDDAFVIPIDTSSLLVVGPNDVERRSC